MGWFSFVSVIWLKVPLQAPGMATSNNYFRLLIRFDLICNPSLLRAHSFVPHPIRVKYRLCRALQPDYAKIISGVGEMWNSTICRVELSCDPCTNYCVYKIWTNQCMYTITVLCRTMFWTLVSWARHRSPTGGGWAQLLQSNLPSQLFLWRFSSISLKDFCSRPFSVCFLQFLLQSKLFIDFLPKRIQRKTWPTKQCALQWFSFLKSVPHFSQLQVMPLQL